MNTIKRVLFGNFWILPECLYKRLPVICLFWASVVWVVPFVWYAVLCAAVLYVYAGWLIYKRYIE
jgi:hypothetical protein